MVKPFTPDPLPNHSPITYIANSEQCVKQLKYLKAVTLKFLKVNLAIKLALKEQRKFFQIKDDNMKSITVVKKRTKYFGHNTYQKLL